MTVFGRRIVLKRFHVVMMAKDEYTSLQQKVKEIAHKLGLPQPKVGLIDDLMPNAFTVGYGRNTLVVFSLGLLEMLDAEELGAVVSHELAHIKAKDHLFKIASYTLNILSFFNPLSYIVASYAQRQRELLADEKGATLISQPKLMANVLTKLEAVMPEFPKTRIADRVFASLFLVSPLAYKPGVLASHPSLSHRVQNLTAIPSKPKRHRRTIVTILLLGILMTTALIAGCSAVELRLVYTHNNDNPFANGNGVLVYNASAVYTPNMQKGILFTDRQSFDNFMSFMKDPSPAENTTVNSNEDLTLKAVNSP
jgi:heat shock protein HtpX